MASARNPLERRKNKQIAANSPRNKKIVVLFFSFFAILILIFSGWRFYKFLNEPFRVEGEGRNEVDINAYLDPLDSDSDGLSDYDEINIYHTSPYLPDSDSDGISDYDEIMAGTDPNCPTGKVCNTAETVITPKDNLGTDNNINEENNLLTSGEVTPDFLRQILIQSGSDPEIVEQISDEDLMAAYQEAVNSQVEVISE
ncbi:hypothetical protein GX917_01900 [Candidatus Falkowbacteria bacterium]|jgi:hypothetical protein|nr:hypothetical protein [Candidatus Falkowbacteria bacterium]